MCSPNLETCVKYYFLDILLYSHMIQQSCKDLVFFSHDFDWLFIHSVALVVNKSIVTLYHYVVKRIWLYEIETGRLHALASIDKMIGALDSVPTFCIDVQVLNQTLSNCLNKLNLGKFTSKYWCVHGLS